VSLKLRGPLKCVSTVFIYQMTEAGVLKVKKLVRINYVFKSKYTGTEITQINVCMS